MAKFKAYGQIIIFDNLHTILITGRVTIITILLYNTMQPSIQEVPGANLSLKSYHPDQGTSWSFFISPAKHKNHNSKEPYFPLQFMIHKSP
jgi:hypothetical protein